MEKDNQIDTINQFLELRKIICETTLIIRSYLNTTTNNRAAMLNLENRIYEQLQKLDKQTEETLAASMQRLN